MLVFLKPLRLTTSPALSSMILIWFLRLTMLFTIVPSLRRYKLHHLQNRNLKYNAVGDAAHGSVSVQVEVQTDLPLLPGGHQSHVTLCLQDHRGLQQQVLGLGRRG